MRNYFRFYSLLATVVCSLGLTAQPTLSNAFKGNARRSTNSHYSKLPQTGSFQLSFAQVSCSWKEHCSEWECWLQSGKKSLIYMQICQDASGKSAYYHFKNENAKAVRISFQIEHKNGKTTNGSTRIEAKAQGSEALCTLCARAHGGGNISWKLTKIAFEGEEGFW